MPARLDVIILWPTEVEGFGAADAAVAATPAAETEKQHTNKFYFNLHN